MLWLRGSMRMRRMSRRAGEQREMDCRLQESGQ